MRIWIYTLFLLFFVACKSYKSARPVSYGGAWSKGFGAEEQATSTTTNANFISIQKSQKEPNLDSKTANFVENPQSVKVAGGIAAASADTTYKQRFDLFNKYIQKSKKNRQLSGPLFGGLLTISCIFLLLSVAALAGFLATNFLLFFSGFLLIGLLAFLIRKSAKKKGVMMQQNAMYQMRKLMMEMLIKPDVEGVEMLTGMMLQILKINKPSSEAFKFVAKWYEGGKYIFNASQKARIDKALAK